jgi:hypothetical protein
MRIAPAVLLVVGLAAAPAFAQTRPSVPVMVGGDADLDACATLSEIVGLNPRGDGFLSVRSGPGTRHAELDRLTNGARVYSCAEQGEWIGIIYPFSRRCGVATPWPVERAYEGPCRSGWVHRRFVRGIAG